MWTLIRGSTMGPDGLPICQNCDGCFADTITVNSITVTLCFCPEALRVGWHILVAVFFTCLCVCVCVLFELLRVLFLSVPAVHNWQVIWWHGAPCRTTRPGPFYGKRRSCITARQRCSSPNQSFVSTFFFPFFPNVLLSCFILIETFVFCIQYLFCQTRIEIFCFVYLLANEKLLSRFVTFSNQNSNIKIKIKSL